MSKLILITSDMVKHTGYSSHINSIGNISILDKDHECVLFNYNSDGIIERSWGYMNIKITVST